MSRLLGRVMVGLWLMGIAACTPGTGLDIGTEDSVLGPWRHWQPDGMQLVDKTDGKGKQPAAGSGSPKAVILALHGFNDYSNAFQAFAAFSKEKDIAVHAYDQKSFGANPDRGLWPGVEPLTEDLRQAVAKLRTIYGDTPLYVLGESMGGAVTIIAATDGEPLDVDGIILSAPAVWGGPHMNPFYRLTLWIASTIAPGWTLSPSGLKISPSDNIEMLRAYSADPLVIKVTRTDAIAGLVDLMDRALASAPKLDMEVLLLVGEKDEIVPGGALEDFQSRLETAALTSIRYPDGYHMLLRDLQRGNVFVDIDAWIDHRAADPETTGRQTFSNQEKRGHRAATKG